MVATFSPHRDAGGTVQLRSPSSIAHMDAIAELRRSLSRSPSKNSELRSFASRSHSPSATNLPFSPSPLSPRRSTSDNHLFISAPTPSPLAIPFPPSAKIQRPGMRRGTPSQTTPRTKTSPKSASNRVLVESTSKLNSTPLPFIPRRSFENDSKSAGPEIRVSFDQENGSNQDSDKATRSVLKRHSGNFSGLMAASSPLKRSDGIMNLDQASMGSPSAKRRSLHGATFGADFNIFDAEGKSDDEGDSDNQLTKEDGDLTLSSVGGYHTTHFSTIPRRSSSLRKSTLQQRQHERPPLSRTRPLGEMTGQSPLLMTASINPKTKQRMSLDNHLASPSRDSPFSSGVLPNASIHIFNSQQNSQHMPHPLSRTMTQSSSSSSIAEDSPTHEPMHKAPRPRTMFDFSKSLPIGASRPTESSQNSSEGQGFASQGSFATPASYKFAKPLPAAFMSTGLISKKNRNADEPLGGLPKSHMPDTPCKRASTQFTTAGPEAKAEKPKPHRHESRHSFGTPSTPFNSHLFGGTPAKAVYQPDGGLFGNTTRHPVVRRASFVSIEGEDKAQSQSPVTRPGSQSTTDSDFPPTPTKRAFGHSTGHPHQSRPLPSSADVNQKTKSVSPFASSKLVHIISSPISADGDSDSVMDDSPSATLRLKSSLGNVTSPASFTKSRLLKNLNSPTPLSRKALTAPSLCISASKTRAKILSPSSASPQAFYTGLTSPHTPYESLLPPDPSGLSISAQNDLAMPQNPSSSSSVLPATPTAPREYFPTFGGRTSLALTGTDATDVDAALTSRFEKVELIGTGEFSQVYRVAQPPESSPFHSVFTLSTSRSPSQASLPERVWAVKKSKYPYAGAKDRQKKIHEVDVLKALGQNDHIISFVDSWEQQSHLYIQTEFCEEGGLDLFLSQVGLRARLDDFRIWKILLELSLGLKHIHDHGFIHLDLKPANILITFEGVLKIADFGMATKWPAKAGIEGEGDREYIGPEILKGQYDKPADVFALGLIMLETAGNVELPDNGVSWQKLRNGDMSDVPSLTWSSEASNIFRDASGNPLSQQTSAENLSEHDNANEPRILDSFGLYDEQSLSRRKSTMMARSGELTAPPDFMIDASHEEALDRIVRWMISPEPPDRPKVDDILQAVGVQWADTRRRAGATVFEGNWGPADDVLAEDAEMIDV